MPVDREHIVTVARSWVGVPFAHQGRSRSGVDCGGLLLCVAHECGIDIEAPPAYSMSPDPELFTLWLNRYCERFGKYDAAPGMVAHMSFSGQPRHLAIISNIGLIHAWAKPGRVVEHSIDAAWSNRIISVWSIK